MSAGETAKELPFQSNFNVEIEKLNFDVFVVNASIDVLIAKEHDSTANIEVGNSLDSDIKRVLEEIEGKSTMDKSKAIQNFYSDLDIRFELQPDRLEIIQKAEAHLLTTLLPDIYSPIDTEDDLDDRVLLDKMNSLEKMPMEDLANLVTLETYAKAIESKRALPS